MKKQLDLNKPADAKEFLLDALPEAMGDSKITYVVLKDGRNLMIKDMNDSELVQYAFELLPIFQAAFPEHVEVHNEH